MGIRVHGLGAALATVPSAAWTAIPLASVLADTDPAPSMWAGASATRLTVRTAGTYALTGHLGFASNATGARQIGIRLNGTYFVAIDAQGGAMSGVETDLSIATAWPGAVVGDYFELMGWQGSGGALAPIVSAEYSPALAAVLIAQS